MSIAEKLTTIAENEQRVFEAGRRSFMETYQGNATDGSYLFASPAWGKSTFYPVKDISLQIRTFYYFSWFKTPYIDLAQRLEDCGVKILPVTTGGAYTETFTNCHVTRLPELDFSRIPTQSFERTFYNAQLLVTIDKLILGEHTGTFNSTFERCNALKNIVIEGTIASSISFSSSPLTLDSIRSIIASLKDYSGTTTTKTLTLKATASQNLTDEDRQNITNKGWSLVEA